MGKIKKNPRKNDYQTSYPFLAKHRPYQFSSTCKLAKYLLNNGTFKQDFLVRLDNRYFWFTSVKQE